MAENYLVTILCKKKIEDRDEYIYVPLGSKIGTINEKIFTSITDGKEYKYLENNKDEEIVYYRAKLVEGKDTQSIDEEIKEYTEKNKKITYYVIKNDDGQGIVIAFDKDKWL